ncbi:hypothetical protein LY78DRAFT_663549 [Colletotrichum sublineola]|nr:hypothetical protein LY78DRAFT_663549 [Colletotrichum sublineola]
MNLSLVFVEQKSTGITTSDRRAIRCHVMRGKNAGRPRPSTRRRATNVPIKRQLMIPRRVFWNDFCLTSFPQELDSDSTRLMHRWFHDISDTLFPPQFCYKFDILKSIWVNIMLVDKAYFHSTLAVSASYVDFFERKSITSPKTLHHICQAYSLVNSKLSGPQAISDSAIAAVVTLAIYQQIHQQYSTGLIHLKGLYRMIQLRGGITRLMEENRPLALKPLRLDVELAMQNGSPTLFDAHTVPVTSVLCDSRATRGEVSASPAGLPRIILDLIIFADILNDRVKKGRAKLNPLDYTETLISLIYRLLGSGPLERSPVVSEEPNCKAARLAMLAFMTSLLPSYCRSNFSSSLLCTHLVEAIQNLLFMQVKAQDNNSSLLLWILFISGISVLKLDNHSWLLSAINMTCKQSDLYEWAVVHHRLIGFPWIYTLHDAPARSLWNQARL